MNHGEVVEFNGVKFLVEVVSPTYRKLIPVEEPGWLYREIDARLSGQKN